MRTYPENSLMLVADGTQALFYRIHYVDGKIKLCAEGTFEPQDLEHDGPSGVQPPETSPDELDEATFAKQLAHQVNRWAEDDVFQSLVLVLDPQTLGQLRPVLSQKASGKVQVELAKTLTNSTVDEIVRSLEANA